MLITQYPFINYFRKGFFLFNRNLEIYFIGLFLVVLGSTPELFGQQSEIVKLLLGLFSFLPLALGASYNLSIPTFFLHKQEGNKLSLGYLLRIIWQNIRRLVKPTIAIFVIFWLLLSLIGIILGPEKIVGIFESWISLSRNPWSPLSLLIKLASSLLFSFLIFVPIFFTIEKNGIFTSLKKSCIFALKNLNYTLGVIFIFFVWYCLSSLLSIDSQIRLVLYSIVFLYIGYFLLASSLLYYQNRHPSD